MPEEFPADVEAEVRFLTTAEGGRRSPVTSGYRSGHISYDGLDWIAVQVFPGRDRAQLGETVRALISFMSPDEHVGKLLPGKEFSIREGGKTVGKGKVTKLMKLADRK